MLSEFKGAKLKISQEPPAVNQPKSIIGTIVVSNHQDLQCLKSIVLGNYFNLCSLNIPGLYVQIRKLTFIRDTTVHDNAPYTPLVLASKYITKYFGRQIPRKVHLSLFSTLSAQPLVINVEFNISRVFTTSNIIRYDK